MVEGGSSAPVKKAGPPGLSISLPDDDDASKDKKAATSTTPETNKTAAAASGRTSAKGAEPGASGQKSARGEDGAKRTSGRTSARGGLSSRGGTGKTVICFEAVIKGNVTFGEGCIVHPGAQILAEGGDIIFGDYNIVEEYARIIN